MSMSVRLCVLATFACVAFAATQGPLVFGKNDMGSLGITEDVARFPQTIASLDNKCVKHVATSHSNSIFVLCDGGVQIVGARVGERGQFSAISRDITHIPVPIEAIRNIKFVMAAVGDAHFVLLSDQGRVYTWGMNNEGQLGHGTDAPFATEPVEVLDLSHKNIRMIAAGGNRTGAITDNGLLYLWGQGTKGEMGDGANRSHRRPKLVQSFTSTQERVCQVAIGGSHVVAVTNAGDLYAWGDGAAGQLGFGDFGAKQNKPRAVTKLRKNACFAAAGDDFSAVVTQDERVFLWGSNGYPSPFEKVYFQGRKARQIGSGAAHMVVLLANGTVVSWGSRRHGQAGRDFTGEFTLEPAVVDQNVRQSISQLAVGRHQTVLLGGKYPAVSLCPCLHGYYSFWTEEQEYFSRCTDEQSQCPDGTCCGKDETCCPVANSKTTTKVTSYYSMAGRPSAIVSNYACQPTANAVCCSPESGLACPKDFKCNEEAKRCDVAKPAEGTSEEDLIFSSLDFVRSKRAAGLPGADLGSGACGPRKMTCPDETCCNKGSSCCPMKDGSFGCCLGDNISCCKSGCCAEGFQCDESGILCVRTFGGQVVEKKLPEKVQNQCGQGKRSCPDRSCCFEGFECCALSDGFFGCCPFTDGVCCSEGAGCCPNGHTCDVSANACLRTDNDGSVVRIAMKATPRNTPQRSVVGEVTCPNDASCPYPGSCCEFDGKYVCCDFVNGTCCGNGMACCPRDYECSATGSTCKPIERGPEVPMKFTRDPKPVKHVTPGPGFSPAENLCPDRTQCSDNTCCPLGSTCCPGANGEMSCCAYEEAICCANGGCCSAEHVCDDEAYVCRDKSGSSSYAFLPSSKSAPPSTNKAEIQSNGNLPGKCYPDEMLCNDGFCCPSKGTCCAKAFGQPGCCPHEHGVCCGNGGCCPNGSQCDEDGTSCVFPNDPTRQPAPVLTSDTAHPPESTWDVEECWTDEQACPIDGGCCLKTETCCVIEAESKGLMSACCPFENGVCCLNGCCEAGQRCDESNGVCVTPSGEEIRPNTVKGSALHPLSGLAEKDCPDGSVCGPFDTCCSLGVEDGEEIFACCEFENAVCCKDFAGCCPSGYECNAETQTCMTDGREMGAGNNSPSDPPPTYVCLWPLTQCPNGNCCDQSEQCVEQPSGNFKCLPRGFQSCANGTFGCPAGLYCDSRNGNAVCSAVEDNDQEVKKALLRKFWGDDVSATCNTLLIQSQHATKQDDSFAPTTTVQHPPAQYWFPKKLVVKSRATRVMNSSLPTVQASKICQHLRLTNSTAAADYCYMSNTNGHFLMKERDRVKQLVDEYMRRTCVEQDCLVSQGPVYEFQAEEIDPCPCREKPTPVPEPQEEIPEFPPGAVGGEEAINNVANKEQNVVNNHTNTNTNKPAFENRRPVINRPQVEPEQDAVLHLPRTGQDGSIPEILDPLVQDIENPVYTLVMPTRDAMQVTSSVDDHAHMGDHEMVNAKRVETFMGKEGCTEDASEAAVDLDGEEAVQLDAAAESRDTATQTSLAQMEANVLPASQSLMAEMH